MTGYLGSSQLHLLPPKISVCTQTKSSRSVIVVGWIEYLRHSVSLKGVWPSMDNLKVSAKYPEPTTYSAIKVLSDKLGTIGTLSRTVLKL